MLTALQVWNGVGPNAAELALLGRVPDGLFTYCARLAEPWTRVTAALNCQGPTTGVTYVSFVSQADMQAAYDQEAANNAPPPSSSDCGVGKFEGSYSIGGVHVGRWFCIDAVVQTFTYHEMEWTQERTALLAFAATRLLTWPAFIDYTNGVGPLP